VPKPGTYRLTLYYADSHAITDKLQLRVNDGTPAPVHLFSYIYGSETLPVTLKAGENSLTFSNADPSGNKVNIDRIRLYLEK
ncbi:MAG TPA: hypothetical protein VK596_05995, partial [Edaphobacter sp.]|nr:hypothetical protein [Edaphobacter sp.]